MDGALNSSRDYGGGGGGYRGGGGGRGGYRSHHHHRRRDYRGGHYHGRRGRGRGHRGQYNRPRPQGNRYGQNTTRSVDQQVAMMQQLSAMVSRVGELKATGEEQDTEGGELRGIVAVIAKNITDLCAVLCSEGNANLFLTFEKSTSEAVIDAKKEAGNLAHLVVACVAALPLSTPTYVALTLAVNQKAPESFAGFASRCVTYAMRVLSHDLDQILMESQIDSVRRVEHLLRYLALLAKINIVVKSPDDEESFGELLQTLVTAAVHAASEHYAQVAAILAYLVLSTIPYTLDYLPKSHVTEQLVEPLETSVLHSSVYTSTYWPGLGKNCLLLAREQVEDDEEEEEEEEEDYDEDAGTSAGQRCDTLQDLMRVTKVMLQQDEMTKFTLLTDAPWMGLFADSTQDDSMGEGAKKELLVYTDKPLGLVLSSQCRSIPCLLNISSKVDEKTKLHCLGLDGVVVFGRLPIFGTPANEQQDEDEDEEDQEDQEEMEVAPPNEALQSYQKNYSSLDRYLLAQAVRDSLFSHKSDVSASGLERGDAKDTARQVWAVTHVLQESEGAEYAIVETMYSLILQSPPHSKQHFYFSLILLELTRLEPTRMSQALVAACSTLFQDYLPSLVPMARASLSAWFSLHLTNTDYQWPAAYWKHWKTNALSPRNSRGDFVVHALQLMASTLSDPVSTLSTQCIPSDCLQLLQVLVPGTSTDPQKDNAAASIVSGLVNRIWDENEDPDTTRAFILGDEISETFHGDAKDDDKAWWRSRLLFRALCRPAKRQRERMSRAIEQVQSSNDQNMMQEDDDKNKDVMTEMIDILVRYQSVLIATLAKDVEEGSSNGNEETTDSLLQQGEALLLMELQGTTDHSRVLLTQCMSSMLQNKIVSSMGVYRWVLGDFGNGNSLATLPAWWDMAQTALRVGMVTMLADAENDNGMTIDTEGEPDTETEEQAAAKVVAPLMEYGAPLVSYVVKRVCGLLQGLEKRFTPIEVDWMQGLKQLAINTQSSILFEAKKRSDNKASAADLLRAISESDLSGTKLAALCRSSEANGAAIEEMSQILEGI